MEPATSRGRLGGFQAFQSSLSYLIRDTEKNLQQGVYGTTDTLAGGGLGPGASPAMMQTEEAKEDDQSHPIAPRRPIGLGRGAPASPPLGALDGLLDPPVGGYAPISYPTASNTAGGGAMNALHSHLSTQDSLAAVRAQARESAEGVAVLQGTLTAFKQKMRSAFDVNMGTLDRKVRLIRKDILHHISDTTAELEKRMVDHLKHGVVGQSDVEAAADSEFKRNTQEELLYLKSELSKQHFAASERVADLERTRRARDHAFTSVQSRVDEHHSLLQDVHAAVYATEKENLLLRAEMEQLKTRLRREVGHTQADGQNKFVELAKGMAEMKKTMEAMVRREQEAELDRTESHAQLAAHINSAAQTYIDEQLFAHAASVKSMKRAQLLQADEIERLKKELGSRTRWNADTDPDDASFVAKAMTAIGARVDGLERDVKLDRSLAAERAKDVDIFKQEISTSEQEARAQLATSARTLREDIVRVEKDGLSREQHARTWREELNTWSRNLEQTILNLKYSVNTSTLLNTSSADLAASQSGGRVGAPISAANLEHPSESPLSQALTALEQRTTSKFNAIDRELNRVTTAPPPPIDENRDGLNQLRETVKRHVADTTAQINAITQRAAAPAPGPNVDVLSTRIDQLASSVQGATASSDARLSTLETKISREADELRVLQLEVKRQATLQNYQHQLHVAATSTSSSIAPTISASAAALAQAAPLASPSASKLVLPRTVPAFVVATALSNSPPFTATPSPAVIAPAPTSTSTSAAPGVTVAVNLQSRVERVPDTPLTKPTPATGAEGAASSSTPSTAALAVNPHQNQSQQRLRAHSLDSPPKQSQLDAVQDHSDSDDEDAVIQTQPVLSSAMPQAKSAVLPASIPTPAVAAPAPAPVPAPVIIPASAVAALPVPAVVTPVRPPAHFSFDHSPDPTEDMLSEVASPTPVAPVPFLIRKTSGGPPRHPGALTSPLGAALRRASSGGPPSPLPVVRPGLKILPLPTAASVNAAAAASSATVVALAAPAAAIAKPTAPTPIDDESSSEDESSNEDMGAALAAGLSVPAATKPIGVVSSRPLQTQQRVPESPTAAGGDVDDDTNPGEAGDSLDDEDHTGGVPHSVLSAAVKQRYLDAERAGQVDGEADLDEDSLYDPEDHHQADQSRPVSERARQIAAALAANASHRRGYDHSDDADEDDLDLDETAPPRGDLSLNSKFRNLQAGAKQQAHQQYSAAHHTLQSGQAQWDSEEDEDEDEESGESPIQHTRQPLASSTLPPPSFASHRAPLSNPALSVSELSPLGKPLKSSLGSLRPGQSQPGFLKAPLGSPKSMALTSQQAPKPLPQPLPARAPLPTFGGASAALRRADADEFDYEDDDESDMMSSLSSDYRRLGAPAAALAAGQHPAASDMDDDLSSPRVDELRSPGQLRGPGGASGSSQLRAAAGGSLRQSIPRSTQMHADHDEEDMDSLFDTTNHGHGQGGDASFVSELDQMELSQSHDAFNTDF